MDSRRPSLFLTLSEAERLTIQANVFDVRLLYPLKAVTGSL